MTVLICPGTESGPLLAGAHMNAKVMITAGRKKNTLIFLGFSFGAKDEITINTTIIPPINNRNIIVVIQTSPKTFEEITRIRPPDIITAMPIFTGLFIFSIELAISMDSISKEVIIFFSLIKIPTLGVGDLRKILY